MGEAPRLKPRTFSEILDASFRLYRENFISFIGILAIVYVPMTLVLIVVTAYFLGPLIELQANPNQAQNPQEVFEKMIGPLIALYVALFLIYMVAIPIASGALTRAVGARYLNEEISIGKCYGHILGMVAKYVGTILLAGLVIGLGLIACCIPFFLFSVLFAFTAQVCVLEGLGGTAAMGRSYQLGKGHWGRIFGMWVLSWLLPLVLSGVLGYPLDLILQQVTDNLMTQHIISQSIQQVVGLLIQPFFIVAWILLYYDLRIRKEAFDLEVLAKTMGSPGGFFPPPPASPPPGAGPA